MSDWPEEVQNVYDKYLGVIESGDIGWDGSGSMLLQYGPAHIVWADGNFDDRSVDNCIRAAEIVLESLRELRNIPTERR